MMGASHVSNVPAFFFFFANSFLNYEFIIYAGNLHCRNPMSYEVSLDGNFGTGNVAYYVGSNGLLEHESAH